jgi:hypothetical protein
MNKTVYMILGVDRGDGHHRLDTSGVYAYSTREAAEEDLSRFLMNTGYAVFPITVVDEPQLSGYSEQRKAWDAKHPYKVVVETTKKQVRQFKTFREADEFAKKRAGWTVQS